MIAWRWWIITESSSYALRATRIPFKRRRFVFYPRNLNIFFFYFLKIAQNQTFFISYILEWPTWLSFCRRCAQKLRGWFCLKEVEMSLKGRLCTGKFVPKSIFFSVLYLILSPDRRCCRRERWSEGLPTWCCPHPSSSFRAKNKTYFLLII